jgi:hypothetical protein
VVLWFVLVAGALAVNHPNQKSRFLHTWVAAMWVGAGVGLTQLLRPLPNPRWRHAPLWLGTAAVGGLGLANLPGFLAPGHSPEAGPRPGLCSTLELTDCYLPYLAESRRTAILSTMPLKFLTRWTYLERYHEHDRVETDLKGFGTTKAEHRRCFENWLRTTPCEMLVYIDVPPESAFYTEEGLDESHPGLLELLAGQSTFRIVHRQDLAPYGCSVTVWSRKPETTPSPARVCAPAAQGPVGCDAR